MSENDPTNIERLRTMAQQLDCIIEEDFRLLAGATPLTVEAWRKRGTGPDYIRLGTRYLYPLKGVAKHLEALTRERKSGAQGAALL